MKAAIISTGDELALGQTVDTNTAWIARQLSRVGCEVLAHMTVGDDRAGIAWAIREHIAHADWILISGGLGPTADDLTRDALTDVLAVEADLNEAWVEKMHEFFTSIGKTMPDRNKVQAMIPRGATIIDNSCGTAPGILAEYRSPERETVCRLVAMPGVPREMKAMFAASVLPMIEAETDGAAVASAMLHTFGHGESALAEMLGELMTRGRNPSVGTTVSGGIVSLRINSRFPSAIHAGNELEKTVGLCKQKLGSLVFGRDEQTLPIVAAEMLQQRQSAGEVATVATAESCTGGYLAKLLTDIPGSSGYFNQGWVVYSNHAKAQQLGIDPTFIENHGAVSNEVVTGLAQAAREKANATYALAISGVAGPDGGTETKPVGTVHIALAHPSNEPAAGAPEGVLAAISTIGDTTVQARRFHLHGERDMIRLRACYMALTMLRFHLLGEAMVV